MLPSLAAYAFGALLLAVARSDTHVLLAGLLCGVGHSYAYPVFFSLVVARANTHARFFFNLAPKCLHHLFAAMDATRRQAIRAVGIEGLDVQQHFICCVSAVHDVANFGAPPIADKPLIIACQERIVHHQLLWLKGQRAPFTTERVELRLLNCFLVTHLSLLTHPVSLLNTP